MLFVVIMKNLSWKACKIGYALRRFVSCEHCYMHRIDSQNSPLYINSTIQKLNSAHVNIQF